MGKVENLEELFTYGPRIVFQILISFMINTVYTVEPLLNTGQKNVKLLSGRNPFTINTMCLVSLFISVRLRIRNFQKSQKFSAIIMLRSQFKCLLNFTTHL